MSARRTKGKGYSSWATPRSCEAEGGLINNAQFDGNSWYRENKQGIRWGIKLKDAVAGAEKMWPTPRSQKVQWIGPSLVNRNKGNLEEEVAKEYWPTPKNRDYRSPRGGAGEQRDNPDLNVTAYMQENKPQKGQLNPAWVECLMNFPPGWTEV